MQSDRTPTFVVPAVIRGQVLKQGAGWFVRGQYVIGRHPGKHGGFFWYDMYDQSIGGQRLQSEQDVFDAVGKAAAAWDAANPDFLKGDDE